MSIKEITFGFTKCETMEHYLKSHPLISTTGIEKALGLTHGLLRKGKPIPEKYRGMIAELLSAYGYDSGGVKEKPVEVIKQVFEPATTGRQCIVRRITRLGIGEHAYIFGKMEGGIFKRDNDVQDNARVTIG